jgi:putative NADPH-quinone reductase
MSDGDAREPVSFLVFAASLRDGSLNAHLAELAAETLTRNGGSVDIGSMTAFDCPSYDADVQDEDGFPDPALEFQRRLEACDAFVISSPEYNASIPGVLKNAIDRVSRFRPQPFHGRNGLLLFRRRPRWSGATGVPGRFAFRWNIWGRACTPTCSRLPKHTSPSMGTVGSPMISSAADSRRRS